MITTVPNKRTTPTLGSPLEPVGLILPTCSLIWTKNVLGKTIHVYSWCKFAGGYETVPGEIRGRLLKISYGAYTKKRNETLRAPSRSLTKKLSYSSQQSIGLTGTKCDANFSLGIITPKPLPLTG